MARKEFERAKQPPSDEVLYVRLTPEQKKRYERLAGSMSLSMRELAVRALDELEVRWMEANAAPFEDSMLSPDARTEISRATAHLNEQLYRAGETARIRAIDLPQLQLRMFQLEAKVARLQQESLLARRAMRSVVKVMTDEDIGTRATEPDFAEMRDSLRKGG